MSILLTNLQYTNIENTNIIMMVQIDGGETFPFHYVPTDTAPVSVLVMEELANGNYNIAPYVPPAPPPATRSAPAAGKSNVIAD